MIYLVAYFVDCMFINLNLFANQKKDFHWKSALRKLWYHYTKKHTFLITKQNLVNNRE